MLKSYSFPDCEAIRPLPLKAFTLAEVLITLAIIGVVAALTVSAVISKATKEQHVTALKKAYNTLKTATNASIQQHGKLEYWISTSTTVDVFFDTYFKSNFDIIRDCKNDYECVFASKYKRLDREVPDNYMQTQTSGARYFILTDGITGAFKLDRRANSFAMTDPLYDMQYATVYIDVNGKKGPNVYGRDLFRFVLLEKGGLLPECSARDTVSACACPGGGTRVTDPQCIAMTLEQSRTSSDFATRNVLSEGMMFY